MSARLSCPSAPGPLEAFSVQCDPLFQTRAQRHGFRTYLAGLLLPRDRSKTLTGGAGRRRAAGSGAGGRGAAAAVFSVRGRLHGEAEAGATDHVARQCLGSVGKIDHGIVALTTLWADEVRHHPLHAAPYTSAVRLADGKRDAAFATEAANCAGPGRAGAGRGRPVQRHRGGLLLWRQLSTCSRLSNCFALGSHPKESKIQRREGLKTFAALHPACLCRLWASFPPPFVTHGFRQFRMVLANHVLGSALKSIKQSIKQGHLVTR